MGGQFVDTIAPGAVCTVPSPQSPQSPLGGVQVDQWGQRFSAGSTYPGAGKPIKEHMFVRYRDHGDHQ